MKRLLFTVMFLLIPMTVFAQVTGSTIPTLTVPAGADTVHMYQGGTDKMATLTVLSDFFFPLTGATITGSPIIDDDTCLYLGAGSDFCIEYDEDGTDYLNVSVNDGSDKTVNLTNAGAGNVNMVIDGTLTTGSSAGVSITGDGDGAITFLGLGDGFDEDWMVNLDDTENAIIHTTSTGATLHYYSGIALVSTLYVAAPQLPLSSTGGALTVNATTLATAAADYDLPDSCDSATGNWVQVVVQDAAETVSLTVSASEDTIVYNGLALDADDELDSPGAVADSVKVVCLATNTWYVVNNIGAWTDGGAAD